MRSLRGVRVSSVAPFGMTDSSPATTAAASATLALPSIDCKPCQLPCAGMQCFERSCADGARIGGVLRAVQEDLVVCASLGRQYSERARLVQAGGPARVDGHLHEQHHCDRQGDSQALQSNEFIGGSFHGLVARCLAMRVTPPAVQRRGAAPGSPERSVERCARAPHYRRASRVGAQRHIRSRMQKCLLDHLLG